MAVVNTGISPNSCMPYNLPRGQSVIEVIPNISEGRRQAVIDAMTTAVLASDDIFLLDASSDPSHNRTVLTMVGDEEPLMAALLRLYAVAVAKIDPGLIPGIQTHSSKNPQDRQYCNRFAVGM